MDQTRVDAVRLERGDRVHAAVLHQDRVALGVAVAFIIPVDVGVEHLIGRALRDRAGDHVGGRARAVQIDLEIRLGGLVAVGHDLLFNDQGRAVAQLRGGVAHGRAHAADLRRLHLHVAALVDLDDRDRVQDPVARARALGVVLLDVADLRVLPDVERVDAVVLHRLLAHAADAAARHDRDVRALADVKVVIHQVLQPGLRQDDRDVHALVLRAGGNDNVDARLIFLRDNVDVRRGLTVDADAVRAQVERAHGPLVQIGDLFEHVLL